ncbi:MAG: phosphoglucosamine mutase [Clostridia bacterium]|nr:phosphoglucosamine mutase [Clostridia bacterium]
MGKYFGTDGFRGKINLDIKSLHALKIGEFLGWYFNKYKQDKRRKNAKVLIGFDTRASSAILVPALISGLTSTGANVYSLGEVSTPCVGYLTKKYEFDTSIMVTASHNQYYDNGLKIFNRYGEKITDGLIDKIENYLDGVDANFLEYAPPSNIGRVYDFSQKVQEYSNFLASLSPSLKGVKVAIDTANGGVYYLARNVLEAAGATVFSVADNPNGYNINVKCGATYIANLQKLVKKTKADIGFSFDGDADRCMCVLANGKVLDGDAMLYILATHLKKEGLLKKNKVVSTVMSNLGLKKSLSKHGINLVQTSVGDVYVYQRLKSDNLILGGEPAGHIIFPEISPSGDGLATAIKLLSVYIKYGGFSNILSSYTAYPQITVNLAVNNKELVINSPELKVKIEEVSSKLIGGRVLVRASGTEPVIRITAESLFMPDSNWAVQQITAFIENFILHN